MDLSYYLDSDESSCECSSEEERTPETILERVYRSIERSYYSSSSSSCCGGAPRIDQDDYSIPSDDTAADDDDAGGGGGGGTKPPIPPGPRPDSDFWIDDVDFPYLTAPKNNVGYRTVNATFTFDTQAMWPVSFGLPGAVTNDMNTCFVSVVEKVSRAPATPAQISFFQDFLFNDLYIGEFQGCPVETDTLLEVTVSFCQPMEFNALFILAPFNPRYVWGRPAVEAWLATPAGAAGDFTALGPPNPVPPDASFQIENWYLYNNDYSLTIPFFNYGVDSLFTSPPPYPGLGGGFSVLPLEGTNKPFSNVYQLGRINSVDFADPVGDVSLTPGDMPKLSYGLTHKFVFDVYPSKLPNTSIWIFGQQVLDGIPPLIPTPP